MRNFIFALLVAVGLSACSDKPTVYTANSLFGGQPFGVTVKLSLNQFTDENKDGDGTLVIAKNPGSTVVSHDGTYPITWKVLDGSDSIIVRVPSMNDAFALERNPMDQSIFGGKRKSFWCKDCEINRNGNLGMLPSMFVKTD
ncbi:hypothetical protein [Ralstonia pseudosolanacearum]|uniref:hypothetical protein n=1 Tax=Ralstonia pseudosolanacearum TaxID=1310165 RepID=UPI003CF93B0D